MGGSWLIKVDADGNELMDRTLGRGTGTFAGRGNG